MKLLFPYFFVLLCLYVFRLTAQENPPPAPITPGMYLDKQDELKKEFGKNKIIPKEIELQALVALSHFPQLKNTHIEFIYVCNKSTMSARPSAGFVFRKKTQRKYFVFINNVKKEHNGVLFRYSSFNAQVGCIGHELAHIADYIRKNSFQILTVGARYQLSVKFRSRYEKETDIRTIEHELGWQLYDFVDYVFNKSDASGKYLAYKKKVYFSPDEISSEIMKFNQAK